MKLFVDTGSLSEVKELYSYGILDGITTNPSLIAKALGSPSNDALSFSERLHIHYKALCDIVDDCVSAEVVSTDTKSIIAEGKTLAGIDAKIVVKVPMIAAGIPALKALSSEGIRTNCTLIFNAQQALLAAKAGATFVSPFISRIGDIGGYPLAMIEDIRTIYDQYGFETQILAASIRLSEQVLDVARAGVDAATLPYAILKALCEHPLTDTGLQRFLDDYQKAKSNA